MCLRGFSVVSNGIVQKLGNTLWTEEHSTSNMESVIELLKHAFVNKKSFQKFKTIGVLLLEKRPGSVPFFRIT